MERVSKMKERPIIFSSEMVRAILEDRKTMTRRPIKVQPSHKYAIFADYKTDLGFTKSKESFWAGFWLNGNPDVGSPGYFKCPHGIPGDQLWVRETWKCSALSHHTPTDGPESAEHSISYKPDGCFPNCKTFKFEKPMDNAWQKNRDGWRSSIHMPRWASRITLEIVNVKVERIQYITHKDALAEGVAYDVSKEDGSPLSRFQKLWNSIYSKKGVGWDKNPWVWVIGFKRIKDR